jgi:hypothetical protein
LLTELPDSLVAQQTWHWEVDAVVLDPAVGDGDCDEKGFAALDLKWIPLAILLGC